ncbi:thioesterase family protein [Mycobacterium sp. AT1]|uniref:acyl-CoA thioesterase n=1 Tax=Mycobacterium sp. AT1 TaxID=1961706 RepID=UPI0009AEA029|nr:thioesterase family protein [Mycobacterium sp. AT1]
MSRVTDAFSFPIVPRYAEVDQQGVVFHGHYLTWFDEASTAFLDHVGVPIVEFDQWDVDLQTVHAELDYLAPVRWRDDVRVEVRCRSTGRTSFTLGFDVVRRDPDGTEVPTTRGRNVYVVVSTRDWTSRELPAPLREALTSVASQGRNAPDGGTVTP